MAEEIVSLKLEVNSKDVKNAQKDLDGLTNSAKKTGDTTAKTTQSFSMLNKTIAGLGVGALAVEFVKTADAMNLLNARLQLTTKSLAEYKSQQAELLAISKGSFTSLSDTVALYTKLDPALKRLGASTAGVNQAVDSFNKGLQLGGATTAETASAVLQFGQAMGTGVLRGEEFNAMMEASPKLMAYLAEGIGKPVTSLRKLAEAGELTAGEVSAALIKMSSKIEEDFKKMPLTVGRALTNAKTDLSLLVYEIDKASGITETFANIIKEAGEGTIGTSDTLVALSSTVSSVSKDMFELVKETNALLNSFNDITEDGAGLSLFEAGLTGLRIVLDTVYVGLHNSIVIAKELVNTSKDLFSGKETNFLENINKQILTMDDLANRYSTSLEKSTQKQIKNNDEIKKGVLDKKAEAKTILAKADLLRKEAEAEKAKEEAAKKAIKAEEDRLKKLHEITQSQLRQIQEDSDKKIKLQEDYYNTLNDIVQKNDSEKLDGLAKEAFDTFAHYDSLIEKYKEVAGAESALRAMQTMAMDTIIEKQKELDEAYNNKSAINSLDEIYGRYEKLIDAQIELAENGMNIDFDFGDGAKELNNISKAMQQLHVGSLKYTKQDIKMQEDYAKAYLEAGDDTVKQAQLEADFDADNAKLNEARQSAEIAGYANLAGAIGSAFEEGSGAAKAFQAIQATLGIVNGFTAISGAWASAPFPANLPAVAATTAAVLPLIGQLASLGGSSGSGGGTPVTSTGFTFEQNREQIEGSYEPLTDRLDRQIELLESIDRQGSASQLGIELAATSFERDAKIWIEDVLEKARQGFVNGGGVTQEQISGVNAVYGADVFQMSGTKVAYNTDVLREGTNLIKTLITASETDAYTGTLYQSAALEAGYNWSNMMTYIDIEIEKDINEYQNLVHDWAMGVLDSMEDLKDAASSFKDYYDGITGSMFYETERLNQAYAEVDKLRGTSSFADYLKLSISEIENLQKFFTDDVFTLLMSNDKADIEAQIAAIDELGRVTGQTFEGGAREALNYLESIELVAEAMTRSRENIKSFTDSLLTDEQLAQNLASSMGVSLATSVDGLAALFYSLSEDIDGLTDSDLDLLNANKALLENTDKYEAQINSLNDTLDDTTFKISTLDSILEVVSSTVEKLRGASRDTSTSLTLFYDALEKAKELSKGTDYEAYASAVKRASDLSGILLNAGAFTSEAEMKFAQLSAAGEFEQLGIDTKTQIDYLREIEINTRTQIDVLVQAMNSLGANVSSSLSSAISSMGQAKTSTSATSDYIKEIYTKYDLNKYQTDTSGYAYWEQQAASGAIPIEKLDEAIRVAAIEALKLPGFATGGYTGDMGASSIAGVVHGGEYVVNAPTTKALGLNDGNGGIFVKIANILQGQTEAINMLKYDNQYYLRDIENNTRGSRIL